METPRRSLTEAIDEVEREANVRERCFPRWVSEGKMTRTDAKDRQERMQAALYYLRGMDPTAPPEPPPSTGITPADVAEAQAALKRKEARELLEKEADEEKKAAALKTGGAKLPI